MLLDIISFHISSYRTTRETSWQSHIWFSWTSRFWKSKNTYFESIVSPTSKLHFTVLIIEWKPCDVYGTRRFEHSLEIVFFGGDFQGIRETVCYLISISCLCSAQSSKDVFLVVYKYRVPRWSPQHWLDRLSRMIHWRWNYILLR